MELWSAGDWVKSVLLLVVVGSIAGAGTSCTKSAPVDPEYVAEIESWRTQRDEGLRKPDGWFSLVGLHWLEDGENVFGSDPGCAVPLPEGKAPRHAGVFTVRDDGVYLKATAPGITVDGEPVEAMKMVKDVDGEPTVVELGSLRFYIIERGEQLGVRVKDTEAKALEEFSGIESYPIDPSWRINARFEPYDPPRTIKIPNVIGTVSESECPGEVVFERGGKEYRLDVLDAGESYWIIFGDQTNGGDTYGGGRFLYTDGLADENGNIVVDFNYAYDPPCAFTPYATCPLPPAGNNLALAVKAGEKMYHGGGH